ncbi:hypothetical protein [Chryseobacterium rhizosphaerae]|uniref:DUF4382 domain-containing protein n=1 Tax=Chryseobacterium rhizosphaerae TaxID=395937 RepID=A0ABX9IEV5_9FLAO|nr:hypothetical protein [Chryseobacterium rhizosphaerae]REC71307.1 hypothetical protein DRF57_20770 [Chryseobacterium rhizosphaerae]GEN69316.1 hypothetical protein CRH01_38840 [Chryseobacterium rhizosphaerae]
MKKILPFILLAGIGFLSFSCDNKDDVVIQQNTNFQMKDATGTFTAPNFALIMDISIKNTDVVLVYRKVGNYWQIIPKTYYLDNVNNLPTGRELDYNFDFNTQEVRINTAANFNQGTQMTSGEINQYLTNQTFRVVLVPANTTGSSSKSVKAPVDYSDYNAVVKYYNLNDSNVASVRVN